MIDTTRTRLQIEASAKRLRAHDDRHLGIDHAHQTPVWRMHGGNAMKTRFGAERRIDASAAVIYHCLADYREHHRPGGFLPPAFEQLEIDRGGIGAGASARR